MTGERFLPPDHLLLVPEYPPGWDTWERHNAGHALASFDLPPVEGTRKRVYRFGARYRAARLYVRASFNEPQMTQATGRGYSELIRLGLTFGAAETLLGILAIRPKDAGTLFSAPERATCLAALRRHDTGARIFQAVDVETKVGTLAKRELAEYLGGRDANPYVVAQAVRHAFFHGDLTPNVRGAVPDDLCRVLGVLVDALRTMMDQEFGRRMAAFETWRATLPDDNGPPF